MAAFFITLFLSCFSIVFSQCNWDQGFATQIQQIQQAAQSQVQQLSYLSSASDPAVAAQIATNINQIYNNMAAQIQQLQSAQNAYSACTWNGYPWSYYWNGIWNGYYPQQAQLNQLTQLAQSQWWNPSIAQAQINQLNTWNNAMARQAQAVAAALNGQVMPSK